MDHQRSWAVQKHLSDVLDELDHGVGVLGHTMVRPSSEEEVLQLERLGRWVSGLMGTRKYSEVWVQLFRKHMQLLPLHSRIWWSCPWFHSQHTPSFQSLSQWSLCLVPQMAYSFHHTSTSHTWTVHEQEREMLHTQNEAVNAFEIRCDGYREVLT